MPQALWYSWLIHTTGWSEKLILWQLLYRSNYASLFCLLEKKLAFLKRFGYIAEKFLNTLDNAWKTFNSDQRTCRLRQAVYPCHWVQWAPFTNSQTIYDFLTFWLPFSSLREVFNFLTWWELARKLNTSLFGLQFMHWLWMLTRPTVLYIHVLVSTSVLMLLRPIWVWSNFVTLYDSWEFFWKRASAGELIFIL